MPLLCFLNIKRFTLLTTIFIFNMGIEAYTLKAQELIGQILSTGLIPEDPVALEKFNSTPQYRNYLPIRVDLSKRFPLPGNQGAQGSCVGWAVGYAARSYYSHTVEGQKRNKAEWIASPAYVYNSIKPPGGCNTGSRISDALNLLKDGSLSIRRYPYRRKKCKRPSQQQKNQATQFKILDWFRVDHTNVDQIKAELVLGHPVVFGMRLTKKFTRLRGQKIYYAGTSKKIDNHAMTVVGYDDKRQAFKVINSWGLRWGQKGFGWISYKTFQKDVHSAFVMRLEQTPKPPPRRKPVPQPKPKIIQIPTLDCSKIELVEVEGKKIARGFVGTKQDLKTVIQKLKLQDSQIDIAIHPWPQCEVLLTLSSQLTQKERPKIILQSITRTLSSGELFSFQVKMPNHSGYLHVAYIQADGSVVHLTQVEASNLVTLSSGQALTYGDGKKGRDEFRIGPPFGNEMIVAIASKSPFFDDVRPDYESDRSFLSVLRKAIIARPKKDLERRYISASVLFLETKQETQK